MSGQEEEIAQRPVVDKGKGKEHKDYDLTDSPHNSVEHLETAYPPINEDVEETRRIEENLRRWEITERQRRKAARETRTHSVSSLVSDVSRRASLLFAGRKGRQHSVTVFANHAALPSQDSIDVVPLTRHNGSTPSPSHSEHGHGDPFANPPRDTLSPFDDVHAARDVPSSPSPSPSLVRKEPSRTAGDAAGFKAVNPPRTKQPPPPKPLNLPPPRSPPPVYLSDGSTKDRSGQVPDDRWWHDWLCGCGEGPDRGGEFQAGHTNPLE